MKKSILLFVAVIALVSMIACSGPSEKEIIAQQMANTLVLATSSTVFPVYNAEEETYSDPEMDVKGATGTVSVDIDVEDIKNADYSHGFVVDNQVGKGFDGKASYTFGGFKINDTDYNYTLTGSVENTMEYTFYSEVKGDVRNLYFYFDYKMSGNGLTVKNAEDVSTTIDVAVDLFGELKIALKEGSYEYSVSPQYSGSITVDGEEISGLYLSEKFAENLCAVKGLTAPSTSEE